MYYANFLKSDSKERMLVVVTPFKKLIVVNAQRPLLLSSAINVLGRPPSYSLDVVFRIFENTHCSKDSRRLMVFQSSKPVKLIHPLYISLIFTDKNSPSNIGRY